MSWWQFGRAQAARSKWEAQLHWFRLRYQDSARAVRCLKLLSRSQACGRIALYYRAAAPIARLYLGVPEAQVRFVRQMAADFGLFLQDEPVAPPLYRLTAVSQLPWPDAPGGELVAHISDGDLFAGSGQGSGGSFWPQSDGARAGEIMADWTLPDPPLTGLAARPQWTQSSLPDALVRADSDHFCWPLGLSQTGVPLSSDGPVNVYGRQEAVTHWLVNQVVQLLAVDAANLVLIDGAGDLVPQLKRKAAVTRLLGDQLTYVDLDNTSLLGGFNPLAPAPGESESALVQRWQCWFQGMGAPMQSLPLLTRAHEAGVGDIPALRQWLKQQERQGQQTAVAGLSIFLNRLTASRTMREWLEWPTNRFDALPQGALFFACKGSNWERHQLLKAALLGVRHIPGVRLILHGLPWAEIEPPLLHGLSSLLLSNGPQLPGSTVVLTACHAAALDSLCRRFPALTPQVTENVALLAVGEGVILQGGAAVWTTWQRPKGMVGRDDHG